MIYTEHIPTLHAAIRRLSAANKELLEGLKYGVATLQAVLGADPGASVPLAVGLTVMSFKEQANVLIAKHGETI